MTSLIPHVKNGYLCNGSRARGMIDIVSITLKKGKKKVVNSVPFNLLLKTFT